MRSTTRSAATPPRPGGVPVVEGSGDVVALLCRGPATITEIATELGLARSTVVHRLELLRDLGLVSHAEGDHPGTRGRPATVTRFNPGAAAVLLAHVGLTGSRIAIADLAGDILQQRFVATPVSDGRDALIKIIVKNFRTITARSGATEDEIAGIGIGLPTTTDLRTSVHTVDEAAGWERDAFREQIQARFRAPVFLDLDVNLLAQAEYRKARRDDEVFLCVKLGTLIDAAILINGEPVHGATGRAGELGHVKVSGSTAPCRCGSTGCLDASASGSALVRRLAGQGFEVDHISQVVRLADAGVTEAVQALRDAGREIGAVLASVVNLLNPGMIIAWGYLTEAETIVFAGIREGLYQAALPESSSNLQVVRTALGDLAGVDGAAMMVLEQVLAPAALDRVVASGSWARSEPMAD
jgi:predicted NBD/HSP70 family sugar kinase